MNLFSQLAVEPAHGELFPGAVLMRGLALAKDGEFFQAVQRTDAANRILLEHGDVIVWGGPSRMRFRGVLPVKPGWHVMTGLCRYNLTFREIA